MRRALLFHRKAFDERKRNEGRVHSNEKKGNDFHSLFLFIFIKGFIKALL